MLSQSGSVYSTLQYSRPKAPPSCVGSLPILDVQMEIAKRTMIDGSFHDVILAVSMMDSALTAPEEVGFASAV